MADNRHNGAPRLAHDLHGIALDLPPMPPLRPGYCNFCGEALQSHQLKHCSKECKTAWDREMRNLGHKLAEAAVYWNVHRASRASRDTDFYRQAFERIVRLPRDFYSRLVETRRRNKWGRYGK